VRDQGVADRGAPAEQQVHHAGRRIGLLEQPDKRHRGQRVSSLGLITATLPAASAGASFQEICSSG